MLALLSLPAQGAARYQVCDFTCAEPANASWLACRAEKCTPRLPEDLCSDGSEPTLTPEPGAKEGEGRAVAGPAECAEAGVPALGSFAERCELCLSLAQSAINLARQAAALTCTLCRSRAAAVPHVPWHRHWAPRRARGLGQPGAWSGAAREKERQASGEPTGWPKAGRACHRPRLAPRHPARGDPGLRGGAARLSGKQ